ncbi:putative integral membrane protein [Acanthocheilonema viteae]
MKLRRSLLLIDIAISFIIGAFLFFTPSLIAYFIFIHETDGVHWHLLRCIGGQRIGAGFLMYRLRNSSIEALSTCYLVRILGLISVLLILVHCSAETPNLIHPNYLKIAKYWCYVWLAVNFCLQTAHRWTLGEAVSTNIMSNTLFQMDSLVSVIIGAAWLAFPEWLLHRQVFVHLGESHEFCARLMGTDFLTSYVVSNNALHWEKSKDRLVVIDTRFIICMLTLIAQIWSQYAYSDHWNGRHWIGISLISSWTITALLLRYHSTMQIKRAEEKAKLH